ncbi:choice-of-anchor Q domain-containing protein [Candidatus Omnitrophota bacterium]
MLKSLTFCLLMLLLPALACADTLYVSPGGSGSACLDAAPCALDSAITVARAGDDILLSNGFYGDLRISGQRNSGNITIAAQPGHNPGVRSVVVSASSRWIISGLNISPELTSPYVSGYLVHIRSDSDNITIEDNNLFYTRDASGWSAADWTSRPARYALLTEGTNITIRNNRLSNVYFGIIARGEHTLIAGNTVNHIAGDGMGARTSNITFENNTIKNFYKVNDNHDDAIQFHRGGNLSIPIENIIIRGNLVIDHEPNLTNSLLTSPQGICGFDGGAATGFLRNFVVENNVVLTGHWHALSFYGATDSRVVNNIAFDPSGRRAVWISFDDRGRNCIVRNNMASSYHIGGSGVTADHNIDIDDYGPGSLFLDYRNYDLRHRAGSPAIDAGSSASAPSTDINGNRRPHGSGYDIGAYEYGGSGGPDPDPDPDPSLLYGDVSENGSISAYDASLAAQYAVGSISLTADQITAADVTGNGDVSATDASWVARKAVDSNVEFPVE